MLLGSENLEKLFSSTVAVFGVGGVGSYTVEALVRSGVGRFLLFDDDSICLTNLNRQLHALRSTVGKSKVEMMKARILDIQPKARVEIFQTFVTAENAGGLLSEGIDYIVDAIDTVSAKIQLAVLADERGIPIISSMGMGNKLDPTMIKVSDIHK
ncbi:MAG TPA: ThiF family adenylyltransferase, partial [Chroococcales cyanobacterium]